MELQEQKSLDEELLLTPLELKVILCEFAPNTDRQIFFITEAQAEKASKIWEARCRERVERIFRGADQSCPHRWDIMRERYIKKRECATCWQKLKREELG